MDIFQYLNKKDVLRNMTDDDFEVFLPKFTKALHDHGFHNLLTYYNGTIKNYKEDWSELCERKITENNVSSTNIVGVSILRKYMPHIYDVENYKGQSVVKSWNYEVLEKAIRVNRQSHSTPYVSEIIRQIGFVSGTSKVTMYRPLLTKRIVQYFDSKTVLDVCIGWGGRMLGSVCVPGVRYTGIEPCMKTYQGLQQMCNDLSISTNVNLINDCAENVLPELEGTFDLALTSPPYYNLEVYSDESTQSHNYGSYTQWVQKFLKPVVFGVLDHLNDNGKSAWSVKNIKTDKQYNLYDDIVKIHKMRGWEKMDVEFYVGNPIRPGMKKDKDGKMKVGQEITYIFAKTSAI